MLCSTAPRCLRQTTSDTSCRFDCSLHDSAVERSEPANPLERMTCMILTSHHPSLAIPARPSPRLSSERPKVLLRPRLRCTLRVQCGIGWMPAPCDHRPMPSDSPDETESLLDRIDTACRTVLITRHSRVLRRTPGGYCGPRPRSSRCQLIPHSDGSPLASKSSIDSARASGSPTQDGKASHRGRRFRAARAGQRGRGTRYSPQLIRDIDPL